MTSGRSRSIRLSGIVCLGMINQARWTIGTWESEAAHCKLWPTATLGCSTVLVSGGSQREGKWVEVLHLIEYYYSRGIVEEFIVGVMNGNE